VRMRAARTACGVARPVWHLPPHSYGPAPWPGAPRLVLPRPCTAREAVARVSAAGCARVRTAARVRGSGDSRHSWQLVLAGAHRPLNLPADAHLWLAAPLGRRTG
jgi:hypothetical protein